MEENNSIDSSSNIYIDISKNEVKNTKLMNDIEKIIKEDNFVIYNLNLKLEEKNNEYNKLLKENNLFRSKINKIKYTQAIDVISKNKDHLNFNKKINGYGIIAINEDKEKFKILFDRNNIFDYYIVKNIEIIEKKLVVTKLNGETKELNYESTNLFNYDESLKLINDINKKEKEKYIKRVLKNLVEYIKYKRDTHGDSKLLFNRYNFGLLIPAIFLTAIISILAFIASSDIYDEIINKNIDIIVGSIGIISTALQTFNGSLNYSGKCEAHSIAYVEYDILYTKLKFELLNPDKSITNPIIYFNETKNSIIEIKKKCNYIIPDEIEEQYKKEELNKKMNDIKNDVLETAIKKKAELMVINISNDKFENIDLEDINEKFNFNLP